MSSPHLPHKDEGELGHQVGNGETQRTGRIWKQREESHFQKQKDLCPLWFSDNKIQSAPGIFNPAPLTAGVSGLVLWRLSAGTFPTSASASLRTHPSAHLGSFSAGRSRMCWQKNLLTCRRLVIFRFREKTLTNLSPQPVFPFPPSLWSPPSD